MQSQWGTRVDLKSMSFRFLTLQLALLSLAQITTTTVAVETPTTKVDVVIVGAGWAGMAAAKTLSLANVSFVVLESSNRTGGRSHSVAFGNPDVWRGIVERGSNWVSGVAPSGVVKGGSGGVAKGMHDVPWENPVHVLARQVNLSWVRVPGSADGNMSGYNAVYKSNGDINGDPNGSIRIRANHALDCLNSSWARKVNKSVELRHGLSECGWNPHTEEEYAVDWALSGPDCDGEPARKESLSSFDPDASYQWWGPDDMFVTEQNPRGFARLVDEMVKDTVPDGDPRVLFNTEVTKMKYDCNGTSVMTQDGRVFQANEVISTLPLGVLQRKKQQLFDPPLPKKQADLLSPESGFVMGNLTHVAIQFPTVWWNDTLAKWLSANKGSNESSAGGPDGAGVNAAGEFCLWHNLNNQKFLPGSHTLLTFLGDPQSSVYEAMTDLQVQTAVVKRLREQHPNVAIPAPSDFFISRHGYDPNSYGAYSVSFAGWNDDLHGDLAKAIRDTCDNVRIRLAGEAMCDNLNGYTHGALLSGKEHAENYLHHHKKIIGPKPLSLCNF